MLDKRLLTSLDDNFISEHKNLEEQSLRVRRDAQRYQRVRSLEQTA